MDVKITLKIREKRKECDVSIRDLEKMAGVSRNYISKIENGLSMPSLEVICKIAKALKVPSTDLYDYK
ncbi:MAG: helix-turn-helix transcriptional regulator [Oscillospiraceae bacterium]